MKPIAVFYHIKISGGDPAIHTPWALAMFQDQMASLKHSGLLAAADSVFVGVNGDEHDLVQVFRFAPAKVRMENWGISARSELPTLHHLQQWLPGHEDWYVCYFHAKGVTHAHNDLCIAWRRCMEQPVIQNWRQCVKDLDHGCDSVGVHWLTREQYGPQVLTFFWGGNFWWAKASFLAELPPLKPTSLCREDDFSAETWIGTGRRPKVKDYAPHWPRIDLCGHAGRCFMFHK